MIRQNTAHFGSIEGLLMAPTVRGFATMLTKDFAIG